MSVAVLGYRRRNSSINDIYTLENADLRYIDKITKEYENEQELILSSRYASVIRGFCADGDILDGEIVLNYIKSNQQKVSLSIIYNDSEDICLKASSLDEFKSETEKARKLLFSSKNKLFLKLFLQNKNMMSTTYQTVKMTLNEYKVAKREGLDVICKDGEYHITINDVLKYRLSHNKLGPMRLLVEDTLEVWKNQLMNMSNEELYFYSRELRVLLNEYNYRKIPRKIIDNLSINYDKLDFLKSRGYRTNKNSYSISEGLPKRKILI